MRQILPSGCCRTHWRRITPCCGTTCGTCLQTALMGNNSFKANHPVSEAPCSELWDLLWEVLHYQARHKLFIHLLPLIKTCRSKYWAHAWWALSVDSVGSRPWNPLGLSRRMSARSLTAAGPHGDERKLPPQCAAFCPLTPHCFFAEYSVMTPVAIRLWFLVEQNSQYTASL